MTTFQVDHFTLQALAGQLSTIQTQMSDIGDSAAHVSPLDLGSPQVYSALQDFYNNWSQGLSTISSNITTVTKMLNAAATAYATAEAKATSAAGGD